MSFIRGVLLSGILSLGVHNACSGEPLRFFHQDDVVLFQGDSITDGGRQRTGTDFNHIMGQDYAYILAAEIGAEYPQRNLTFINRGISGNTVIDLAGRWQSDTLDVKPNLLSILVGINDTMGKRANGESAEQFESIYDKLLVQTLAALPAVRIILGEPFLLPVGSHRANYAAEFAEVKQRQAAVARLATKYHLPLVHYQEAFDQACRKATAEHWSWDGIHPTYAGHALMFHEWMRTASKFWPKG